MQTFERLGAQAGVELQAAARKVARENCLLRTLLRHRGVTSTEIEAYLQGTSDAPRSTSSASLSSAVTALTFRHHLLPGTAEYFPAPERKALVGAQSEPCSCPTLSVATSDSPNTPLSPAISDPASQSPQSKLPHPSASGQSPVQPPSLEGGVKFNESSRKAEAGKRDDVTSCETAAWIIANLRGHDDAEGVRAELGCSSNEDCTVENTTIFHAMDR